MKLLEFFGYKQDPALAERLNHTYDSLRVVGRGTVKVDVSDVHKSIKKQNLYEEAKKIVTGS